MNATPLEWRRHAIRRLWRQVNVTEPVRELLANPVVWNQHSPRREQYAHSNISDIWVRYNPWRNFTGSLEVFNREHDAEWYPVVEYLPSVKQMALDVMRQVEGTRLGGVLITKIPPGGEVKPHIDRGWHAEYYDKFAVQLQGGAGQAFHFQRESLVTEMGDIYTFDNSLEHWVTNESDVDRITLIICVRIENPRSFLWAKE